jgi:hypothetical protein
VQQPLALAAKRLVSSRSSASCNSAGAQSLLHPKSISRTSSDPSAARVSMMLSSLKSRWQNPRACTARKACCAALPCWSLGCCSASNVRPTTLQCSITSVDERTTATTQPRAGSAPGVVCQAYTVYYPPLKRDKCAQARAGLEKPGSKQARNRHACKQGSAITACGSQSPAGNCMTRFVYAHLGCLPEQHMRAALPSGMRQQ